jgi:hypothetical protein
MPDAKLPGEPLPEQQRPIGNAGDGLENGGEAPRDDDPADLQFRGRHKAAPNSEKDGVRPEVEAPERSVNRRGRGK